VVVVVDASVAAKWVLREPGSADAPALLDSGDVLTAPALVRVEGASAIARAYRSGRLEREDADHALRHWLGYLGSGALDLVDDSRDLGRAAELSFALRHPLPDCLYLALAERLDVELLTADGTFARRAPSAYPRVRLFASADG